MLALIDEESNFPKGTDESMLDKLHSSHEVYFFSCHSFVSPQDDSPAIK